jgi:alkylation response protein AidB-like acyl-CoA dehydrogenase
MTEPIPRPPVPPTPRDPILEEAVAALGLEELARTLDRQPAFPRSTFAALGARGLVGLVTPRDRGGAGAELVEAGAALYRLAYGAGATTFAKLSLQPEFCSVLGEHGSALLIEEYFRPLCRGERLIGNQLTEPGAGSDTRALATEAIRSGSEYRITGTKSEAAFAVDAEAAIVYARVPPHPDGPGGITAFLLPQTGPGVERAHIEDLGERWMRRGTVRYRDVAVPVGYRLGEEGRGLDYVLPELHRERALLAMIYLGVARRSLEETVAHVGVREAFGGPLSRQQAVAFPLVEDWAEGEAATLYALEALRKRSAGLPADGEAAMAKWMATDIALRTLDHAIQFHGGRGYSSALPFERRWRDVRSGGLAHGPSELMHVAARRSLWPATRGREPA